MKKQLNRKFAPKGTPVPTPARSAPPSRPLKSSARAERPKVDRGEIQRAYDEKSDTGRYRSYMKSEYLSKIWNPVRGTHVISILPTWSPSEDKYTFFNKVYYHSNVGINEDNYVCMARMYKKRCFICERYAEYIKECEEKDMDPEDEKLRTMRPAQRVLYNVRVVSDERSIGEGNRIFMAPAKKLHSQILELCKNPRTGELVSVGDVDEGMDVQFTKEGEGIGTEYKGIRLVDRDPIPDEWLHDLPNLEETYERPEYEELKSVYLGVPSDDEYGDVEGEEDTAEAAEPEEGGSTEEYYGDDDQAQALEGDGEDQEGDEETDPNSYNFEDDVEEPDPPRKSLPQRKPVRPSVPMASTGRGRPVGRR